MCSKCGKRPKSKSHVYCIACKKEYNAKHYSKNKIRYKLLINRRKREKREQASVFVEWLKELPCQDCKRVYPPVCMDFDHVRGIKRFNISQGVLRILDNLLDEIQKCEIVCANCHRLRTKQRYPSVRLDLPALVS